MSELDRFAGMAPRAGAVRVGDTTLAYLEWGDGARPLLLLHGITSSARGWWRVAPALAARGYHVYALDMPGHGASDETDDHRLDAIAELAAGALRSLTPERAMLIGHSWGGATALALASGPAGRDLLTGLVLIDPSLRMSVVGGEQVLPRYLEGVGLARGVTRPIVRAANPDWHEWDVDWKAEALEQCRADAVRGFFTRSGDWNLTPRLSQVRVPLLLLLADQRYTVVPPDIQPAVERALPPGSASMVTVPGTSHNMLRGGGYDLTMPIIKEWLASVESRRSTLAS